MRGKAIILAVLAFAGAGYGGGIREKEVVLTTGSDSNAVASFLIENGILQSIKVDVVSSAATGNVAVAICGKVSTEADETLLSITSNATDTTVVPCRWYTDTSGTAVGATTTAYTNTITTTDGTNAVENSVVSYYSTTAATAAPYVFHDNTITATVTAVSTVATGKTWRIITRWIEP